MAVNGTKFQLKVWNFLKKIPKGKVRTYLQVAKALGIPKSARAVANAVAKNPNPPEIPCHRVIRSDGKVGGYSAKGGILRKIKLLKIEKIQLNQLLKYID
jgi:methylated-DNA-[protein]-cysteine S-methyltransferase